MEKKKTYKVVKKSPDESDNAGEPVIQFMKSKVLTDEEEAVTVSRSLSLVKRSFIDVLYFTGSLSLSLLTGFSFS